MDNSISEKSFSFSVRIVKLGRFLEKEKKEFVIARQLVKAGTSIGANIAEARHAQSRPDFLSKMNIALKEAAETDYWLRLLRATDYLSEKQFKSIYVECDEIERILASIVKTVKN